MSQARRMRTGPACILFIAVLASCANPPDMVNDPPVASFNDLQASGAATTAVDGFYRENGANEGRPKYDKVGGSYFLFYLLASDSGPGTPYWSIQDAVDTTVLDALYYNGDSTALTAPEGLWSLVLGENPAPTVQRVAITGTLAVGMTLTGHYEYTDPDGDAEQGTTLQWYRFTAVTDTSGGTACEGVGADTSTYTVHSSDGDRFLRLQVTPVDALGLAGTPVLSGAVGKISP